MTAVRLEEKVGKIIVVNNTKRKKFTIDAIRLGGNGHYKYVSQNGKTILNKAKLNPQEYAESLAKAYAKKGMSGQIGWIYKKPKTNHKSYSLT